MTLGERLKKVRTSVVPKISQTEFAISIGSTRPAYVAYELDKVVPNDSVLELISIKYKCNFLWLKTGEGPEKLDVTDDELVEEIMTGSNEYAKSIMKAFARLGDEEWAMLKKVMDKLLESGL